MVAKYLTPASMVAIPAACTTKQISSSRKGRLRATIANWARSDGSLSTTAPSRGSPGTDEGAEARRQQ